MNIPQKITRKKIPWIPLEELIGEPEEFKTGHWVIRNSRKCINHEVKILRCQNYKHGCSALMRIDFLFVLKKFIRYKYSEHLEGCKLVPLPISSLKNEILNIYNNGIIRPYGIKRNFEFKNMNNECNTLKSIDIKKIYSILNNYKKQLKQNKSGLTTDEIEYFCNNINLKSSENAPNAMFLQFNPLVVVFSTINLIKKLKNVNYIHIDGTYKLNDCNFPVIVLGFSDFDKSFFITALSIVETESEDSYFKVLASIKNKCRDYNIIFEPRVFIADNSSYISSAIKKCFPLAKRTNCWAHIVRLITPKLTDTKEFKKLIINDIYFIQQLFLEPLFEEGVKLFLKKWKEFKNILIFIKDFRKLYLEKNSNWYESFDIFSPSTNNCLERFNRTIKEVYTKRERVSLINLMSILTNILIDNNTKEPNLYKIKYDNLNVIETTNCTNVTFELVMKNEKESFFMFLNRPLEEELLVGIKSQFLKEFVSFSEFKEFYSKNIFLKIENSVKDWCSFICSCNAFVKSKKCIHIYLYCKNHNFLNLLNINILSAKRERGRKKKAKVNHSLKID